VDLDLPEVMVNTALGMGAISSSVSTCAGSVNVPANCVAWLVAVLVAVEK
jgi:hypothetical protein